MRIGKLDWRQRWLQVGLEDAAGADGGDWPDAAVTAAIVALLLRREQAAPLAYIGGSLGTLLGADLLNLGNIQGLGAPVASIGGAGTFDGIFLTGILAVLIASLTSPPQSRTR